MDASVHRNRHWASIAGTSSYFYPSWFTFSYCFLLVPRWVKLPPGCDLGWLLAYIRPFRSRGVGIRLSTFPNVPGLSGVVNLFSMGATACIDRGDWWRGRQQAAGKKRPYACLILSFFPQPGGVESAMPILSDGRLTVCLGATLSSAERIEADMTAQWRNPISAGDHILHVSSC